MNNLGYLMMNVVKKLRYHLNTALSEEGITVSQWAVIAHLELFKTDLTAARISDMVGMDRPTISGIVKRLKAKNLIILQPSVQDRRANILKLTPSGEELFNRCQQIADKQMAEFVAPLDQQEQATLVNLLVKLEEGHHVG